MIFPVEIPSVALERHPRMNLPQGRSRLPMACESISQESGGSFSPPRSFPLAELALRMTG
jgi:hypothetical protein